MPVPVEAGEVLLRIARDAIARRLGLPPCWGGEPRERSVETWLHGEGATFVTLTEGGDLRGCMGTVEACRPLLDDVRRNAEAAAFRDPRFAPLTRGEYPNIVVAVSLLSPLEQLIVHDEVEAFAAIRPGKDGVLIRLGPLQGTFLPQVWDTYPDPAVFLSALLRKAGIPGGHWPRGAELFRYRVHKFSEEDQEA